jgi:hypothetical protein
MLVPLGLLRLLRRPKTPLLFPNRAFSTFTSSCLLTQFRTSLSSMSASNILQADGSPLDSSSHSVNHDNLSAIAELPFHQPYDRPDVTTLGICESQSRHLNDQPSQFAGFPREILRKIASFLPTSSAAFLALTCKAILLCLGTQNFHKLRRGRHRQYRGDLCLRTCGEPSRGHTTIQKERGDFLLLLEKDCPHLVFCFFCRELNILNMDGQPNATKQICVRCHKRTNSEDWYLVNEACHWTTLSAMLK